MTPSPSFVSIRTMFRDGQRREIALLSELYSNQSLLIETIDSLTKPHLSSDSIKGKRVLLKPNWVRHALVSNDRFSLCTNENFILATLDCVLAHQPASVVIGDAPIQGCKWNRLLSENFCTQIEARREKTGATIILKDFRRVIFDVHANNLKQAKDNLDEFVIFDLGTRSFLEPITHPTENRFRVTAYNPDRFIESHAPGVHKYCITRELFDADVVLSMPKIKTHQKAGITAALKNIVGINGDKDFLPHHRLGGTEREGDCYPGDSSLRYEAEICYDRANRNRGNWRYRFWMRVAALLWRMSLPNSVHHPQAGWYGNDTTWRMVMDLNLILNYGTRDGTLEETQQRAMFSLCDGIVGGQGNGPLEPEPLALGIIAFSNDSAMNDICCAAIMKLDMTRIPLLVAASRMQGNCFSEISVNDQPVNFEDLSQYQIETKMPPGWLDYRSIAPVLNFDDLMVSQY